MIGKTSHTQPRRYPFPFHVTPATQTATIDTKCGTGFIFIHHRLVFTQQRQRFYPPSSRFSPSSRFHTYPRAKNNRGPRETIMEKKKSSRRPPLAAMAASSRRGWGGKEVSMTKCRNVKKTKQRLPIFKNAKLKKTSVRGTLPPTTDIRMIDKASHTQPRRYPFHSHVIPTTQTATFQTKCGTGFIFVHRLAFIQESPSPCPDEQRPRQKTSVRETQWQTQWRVCCIVVPVFPCLGKKCFSFGGCGGFGLNSKPVVKFIIITRKRFRLTCATKSATKNEKTSISAFETPPLLAPTGSTKRCGRPLPIFADFA